MLDLASIDQFTATRLAGELQQVAVIFERQLASELSAVNALCLHVEQYRGKMLRPTLLVLTGIATGAEPDAELTETHRIVAAVCEMIHMATLVHDDVLDEAEVRRRGKTVSHLWGNETAVMLGDYLISNAFHLCSSANDPEINLALGAVTNTLCEGELVQLHHRNDYSLDEATYTEIVTRKTASLIGEACRLGARLSGADARTCASMRTFGETLGIAFQIQDDLLDLLGEQEVVGKSLGKDLDKGKLTLPVIYHMERADAVERGRGLELIERRDAPALLAELRRSGAIDAASATARRLVDRAREELSTLADTPARAFLETMARAVVERSY